MQRLAQETNKMINPSFASGASGNNGGEMALTGALILKYMRWCMGITLVLMEFRRDCWRSTSTMALVHSTTSQGRCWEKSRRLKAKMVKTRLGIWWTLCPRCYGRAASRYRWMMKKRMSYPWWANWSRWSPWDGSAGNSSMAWREVAPWPWKAQQVLQVMILRAPPMDA